MAREESMLEALRTQSQPVVRFFIWKYVFPMTKAAMALSLTVRPARLKSALAESRIILFG